MCCSQVTENAEIRNRRLGMNKPLVKDDPAIEVFKTITTALALLPDDADRERVLRAAAILCGFEFKSRADR